ncbi:MAG: MotA/TolQ/ExbB proton channel family protein [Castellaniella sp.]|uniref:MotA/TolQ/ExbB proton channel family protein n=1 Tax=Castellaniella sp. TaxID=1955812 RepID=UPI002A3645EE|nr:MotA/TolQ/ExbB proton channel family protein [Castellaniella sp.]MDY0310062.1 MotA/TolQ/ExbB proton channel family protein [Castellaniella sp.]
MLDLIGSAVLALAQAVGPDAAQAAADAAPAVSAATDAATAAVATDAAASAQAALGAGAMETGGQGVLHFIGQSDTVGKSLFVFLVLMSLASWYLILAKGLTHMRIRRRSRKFLAEFWAASSLEQVENEIATHGAEEPFAHLTSHAIHAQKHHAKYGALKLEESGSTAAFVTRTIRRVIDEETARLENGLTVLASVGSTAPFVGLFGTVWGVYHALLSISMTEGVTINRIAGPVGEALIMTGLGLAVAIPAVLAYNAFVRVNRVYLARLDAFAHDLFTFLTTGQQVADGGHQRNGRPLSLASHRSA